MPGPPPKRPPHVTPGCYDDFRQEMASPAVISCDREVGEPNIRMPGGNIVVDLKEPRVAAGARGQFRFGSFTFRLPERMLEIDGRAVRLGSRATELLTVLLTHRGQLVSNRSLQEAVWPGITVDESA